MQSELVCSQQITLSDSDRVNSESANGNVTKCKPISGVRTPLIRATIVLCPIHITCIVARIAASADWATSKITAIKVVARGLRTTHPPTDFVRTQSVDARATMAKRDLEFRNGPSAGRKRSEPMTRPHRFRSRDEERDASVKFDSE